MQLKGTGDVVITATHRSGKSASYTLHVYDSKETEVHDVTGVSFDKKSVAMKMGNVTQLRWALEPKGQVIRNTTVLFESSNESVASVDYSGVVKAGKPGTAVITIHVIPIDPDAGESVRMLRATCKVTVTPKMKGTRIVRLTRSRRALTVKWKMQTAKIAGSHISGYQIQLATNKKFSGKKCYSAWSKTWHAVTRR